MINVTLQKNNYPYTFTEELKQLRTNIIFSGEEKKVILITSSYAGEGKSTLALELSRAFAELGKNVLLIDADMRLSNLASKRTSADQTPLGLSHLLSGQVSLEHILCKTDTPHLYTIFSGRFPPNPSELLANRKMSTLMSWARDNFDFIFIDCPPISVVTDAAVIAPITDGALFVVKAEKVPKKIAADALKLLKNANCPILGVVLNQVKHSRSAYKKRGYGYYYGSNPNATQANSNGTKGRPGNSEK